MPFGGFVDWDDCIEKQMSKGRSKEEAQRICGYIKSRTEGRTHIKKTDPTQAEWVTKKYLDELMALFDVDFDVIFEKPKTHEAASIININLQTLLGRVDDLLEKVYSNAEGVIDKHTYRAYAQGDYFGQIALGLPPRLRKATWKQIGNRIIKSQSDFRGITDEVAKRIRAEIANGIIGEKEQSEIIDGIKNIVNEVSRRRAETMVRTETMRAVNSGVKDRYDAEGVDGFERLEADDEKTCTDWEFNIDGTIYMGCAGIDGKVFTREQADQVDEQTHPNCRGTWQPHISIPEVG